MPQHELLACAQCGCFAFSCFEDFAIRVNKADPPAFLSQIENEPPLERPDGLELYFGNRKLNCMRHSRFELGAVSGRTTL